MTVILNTVALVIVDGVVYVVPVVSSVSTMLGLFTHERVAGLPPSVDKICVVVPTFVGSVYV